MKIKLLFATNNQNKINEAKRILKQEVASTNLEVDEIQSLDESQVAIKKAKSYFQKLKTPLFVEDVSLQIDSIHGLPGTYINDFHKKLGNEGICKLVSLRNRKAIAITTIVYQCSKDHFQIFKGITHGSIAKKPQGTSSFGFDPIFIPKGSNKTFAQMTGQEKDTFSMRKKALLKLHAYLLKT